MQWPKNNFTAISKHLNIAKASVALETSNITWQYKTSTTELRSVHLHIYIDVSLKFHITGEFDVLRH